MKTIKTDIVIDAPQELCWAVLTDFERYAEWNPFVQSVTGTVARGEKVEMTVLLRGTEPRHGKGVIAEYDAGRLLVVKASNPLFTGLHKFRLDPIDAQRTRFFHNEDFTGLLPFFMWGKMKSLFERQFIAMNTALKQRVENSTKRDVL